MIYAIQVSHKWENVKSRSRSIHVNFDHDPSLVHKMSENAETLFMRCKYFGIGTCTTKYVISYFCFNNLKVFLAQSSTFNNPRDYFHFDNETNFIKAFTKIIFLKID